MIDTQSAIKELMDMGFTPITEPSEEPDRNKVFIENEVVWDKLFSSVEVSLAKDRKESEEVENFYQSIKHINWIKKLIIAHNPKLEWVRGENQLALAVVYPEIQKKGDKLPRLEYNLRKWVFIVQVYVTDLLERFDP